MNSWIYTILLTLVPGIELRGSLPLALMLGKNLETALPVILIVNILIVPLAFFIFDRFWERARRISRIGRRLDFKMHRARTRSAPLIEKYGPYGLALFVAIPLPGTGAYTGTLVAWVLGMNRNKAFSAISAGVAAAGVLIYLALKGIISRGIIPV